MIIGGFMGITLIVRKCKHVWRFNSERNRHLRLQFWCSKCKTYCERAASKSEREILKSHYKEFDNSDLHKVWHSYVHVVQNSGRGGYEAQELMAQWAAQQPNGHVHFVGCDDSSHMGSDLWIIEHKTKNKYMGSTVVYIPQDEVHNEFFLYPGHRKELARALASIEKLAKPIQKREAAKDAAWRKITSKWKP
jgi:hypothetical protein